MSLKGTCEEEFSRLTDAVPQGFQLQLAALEHLNRYGANVHPACMISFGPPENTTALRRRLKAINPAFENFEMEGLILYPSVEKRLNKLKVNYMKGHMPDNIPPEQI